MTDLKPCWCGGEVSVEPAGVGWVSGYEVRCGACGLRGRSQVVMADAVDDWNTRAPSWRPIESAPKDGTVIYTNEGLAKWGGDDPDAPHWVACQPDGSLFCYPQYEDDVVLSPTHWMPKPEDPKEGE